MRHIKMVESQEGEYVQWVGVYVLKWQPEWGTPEVAFVEEENPLLDAAPDMLAALKAMLDADDYTDWATAWDVARAAVSKAEQGQ